MNQTNHHHQQRRPQKAVIVSRKWEGNSITRSLRAQNYLVRGFFFQLQFCASEELLLQVEHTHTH